MKTETAEDILYKHRGITNMLYMERDEILSAMKELASLAWDGGSASATYNGRPGITDAPNKDTFLKQLFPEK
jgi:hypothetical protein